MADDESDWPHVQADLGHGKNIACIIIGLALPALFVSVVFLGGIALLVPIAMIGIAGGIIKACV